MPPSAVHVLAAMPIVSRIGDPSTGQRTGAAHAQEHAVLSCAVMDIGDVGGAIRHRIVVLNASIALCRPPRRPSSVWSARTKVTRISE